MENNILIAVIVVCSTIFVLSLCTSKLEVFVNFMLRMLFCILAIYFINKVLYSRGIVSGVQINELTAITGGVLGVPGLFLMYGLFIYFNL